MSALLFRMNVECDGGVGEVPRVITVTVSITTSSSVSVSVSSSSSSSVSDSSDSSLVCATGLGGSFLTGVVVVVVFVDDIGVLGDFAIGLSSTLVCTGDGLFSEACV